VSDITDRIAAVLRQYMYESVHDYTYPDQLEGFSFETADDRKWSEMVAAAVVKELHLQSTGHGHYRWGEGTGIGGWIPDETKP
jgi:hypothetical protein